MRGFLTIIALAAVALSGCVLQISSDSASARRVGTAVIVGVMAADTVQYYRVGPEGKMQIRAPELDPTRKVNVQDCTKPIDLDAGNLMCQ